MIVTSDLHAHVRAWDYAGGCPDPSLGLSRAARLIGSLRRGAETSVLIDGGDFLIGGPLEVGPDTDPFPIVSAMNALNYDVAVAGNHEFDRGLDFLTTAVGHAGFPILSANVWRDGARLFPPVHQMDLGGLTAGFIGFTPPRTVEWCASVLRGRLAVSGIIETAYSEIPRLRDQGCDVIVALCHSGIGAPLEEGGDEALALAQTGLVDVIIMGHEHRVFPGGEYGPRIARSGAALVDPAIGRLAGVPAIMPGCWGRIVGQIDLEFADDGGAVGMLSASVRCHDISDGLLDEDRTVVDLSEAAHRHRQVTAAQPVGPLARPVHTFFSRAGQCRASRLVGCALAASARRAIGDRFETDLPLVGVSAPGRGGGIGGPRNYLNVDEGVLTEGHLDALCPHDNRVALLQISGAQLLEWMERTASALLPGAFDGPLVDQRFPSTDFDLLWGADMTVDLSQPARFDPLGGLVDPEARRVSLKIDGRDVRTIDRVIVATGDFRAEGGGGFPGCGPMRAWHLDLCFKESIRQYLGSGGAIPDATAFSLVPTPGLTPVLLTGPDADRRLNAPGEIAGEDLGVDSSGFRAIRIHLGGVENRPGDP